jgi:HD-like signal output (HDOD) protein
LGVDHAAIGGHLLEKWGMPQEISEAVCFHHQADRNEAPSALAAATYLGNNIAHFLGYGDKTQAPTFHQHQATMERLELGAQQIAYILIATHHGLERAMAMLSLRKTIL